MVRTVRVEAALVRFSSSTAWLQGGGGDPSFSCAATSAWTGAGCSVQRTVPNPPRRPFLVHRHDDGSSQHQRWFVNFAIFFVFGEMVASRRARRIVPHEYNLPLLLSVFSHSLEQMTELVSGTISLAKSVFTRCKRK